MTLCRSGLVVGLVLGAVASKCVAAQVVYNAGAPVVDLGYAKYQGAIVHDKIHNATRTQFLSIRYAAPPTGPSRFRAPALPFPIPGIQLADAEPPMCMQGGQFGAASSSPFRGGSPTPQKGLEGRQKAPRALPSISEDCLFLNVYLPGILGQKKNLPVVVWIHGGGYVFGGATGLTGTDVYDGNDLIRQSGEGVVVIVIQYRLGLFGFLAGQKVKEGGALNAGFGPAICVTVGTEPFSKFGGDPGRVTIWGQSAGAGSVIQHLVANGGKTDPPLFRAGMTSSSFIPSQYLYNDYIPEAIYNETVVQSNCSSSSDTLNCLREADLSILQAANLNIEAAGFYGTFTFVPVVDGDFITDRPTKLLKEGKMNHAAVFSVTNVHEGDIFVNQTDGRPLADYVAQLFPALAAGEIEAVVAQYSELASNIDQANAVMGESIFICPTYTLMQALGGRVFKAEFAIPPALHGDDQPYVFPTNSPPPYQNQAFIDAFSESFMNFVRFLDPNVKWNKADITPTWNLWKGSNEMVFNHTIGENPDIRLLKTSAALLERCKFWDSVSAITAQ